MTDNLLRRGYTPPLYDAAQTAGVMVSSQQCPVHFEDLTRASWQALVVAGMLSGVAVLFVCLVSAASWKSIVHN